MSDTGTIRPQLKGRKFHEGWIEHKDSQRNGWNKYWLVLKQFEKLILFIFRDEHTSPESQVGLLTFDSNTEFKVRDGDAKNGYRFDVDTTNRRNKFKSKMFHEREIWRAYIVGLVKGTLPDDLDLTETQIQMIQSDIDYHKKGRPVSKISMTDSGFGMEESSGRFSVSYTDSIGSGGKSTIGGGPTMTHKFYRDSRSSGVPSWFISGCSRDFAEKILTKARNFGMGNTLLRESTTHMSTGSYVITKRVDHPGNCRDPDLVAYYAMADLGRCSLQLDLTFNTCEFEHYEVARVAEGYKLNVQNDHQPMKCLSEVMDYFIQSSGPTTKLLTNNNFQTLGLDTPDYQRSIPRNPQPLEKSSKSSGPVEPPADYEEPAPKPYPSQSRTFSAVTYEQESRKSGFGRPLVASGSKTFAASHSVRNTTTMSELAYRAQAAGELQNLNDVIEGFEEPAREYYNDPDLFRQAKQQQIEKDTARRGLPPPPPPCNHIPGSHRIDSDVPYQPAPPLPRQMDQAVPPPPPPISSLERLPKMSNASVSESIPKSQLKPAVNEMSDIQQELKDVLKKVLRPEDLPSATAVTTIKPIRQPNTVPSNPTFQRLQPTAGISPPIEGQGQKWSQGQSKQQIESGVEMSLNHSFASIRRKFDAPKPVITDQTFKPQNAKFGGSPAPSSQYKDPKRRASEPVIPMSAKLGSDYVNVKKETEKVDPAFVSKLNQMLTPQSEKFGTRILHQSSYPVAENADDWYEPIPADEVFYLNEKYNK